jgi:hypothetical protein
LLISDVVADVVLDLPVLFPAQRALPMQQFQKEYHYHREESKKAALEIHLKAHQRGYMWN